MMKFIGPVDEIDSPVVSKSRCPLLLASDVSACIWFLFLLSRAVETVVAGAVGKWESRVFCGIPKRSVFSTALRSGFPFLLWAGKAPYHMGSVVHRQGAVQVLAHHHPASRQRAAPAR